MALDLECWGQEVSFDRERLWFDQDRFGNLKAIGTKKKKGGVKKKKNNTLAFKSSVSYSAVETMEVLFCTFSFPPQLRLE